MSYDVNYVAIFAEQKTSDNLLRESDLLGDFVCLQCN